MRLLKADVGTQPCPLPGENKEKHRSYCQCSTGSQISPSKTAFTHLQHQAGSGLCWAMKAQDRLWHHIVSIRVKSRFYWSEIHWLTADWQLQIQAQKWSFWGPTPSLVSVCALCCVTLRNNGQLLPSRKCHWTKQIPFRSCATGSTTWPKTIPCIKSHCFYHLYFLQVIASVNQSEKVNVLQIRHCSLQNVTAPKLLILKNEVS